MYEGNFPMAHVIWTEKGGKAEVVCKFFKTHISE